VPQCATAASVVPKMNGISAECGERSRPFPAVLSRANT